MTMTTLFRLFKFFFFADEFHIAMSLQLMEMDLKSSTDMEIVEEV